MNKLIDTQLQDFLEVDIKTVYPNENQPRKTFNNLDELASSIKIHGLLEPIAVVKFDKGYMIVDGERRFKACNKLNHTTIKIQIFDFDEAQIDEISLVKARQRQDLTPFEYAKKIGEMWNSGRYKKKEHLARAIGESQTFISKCFSSLRLDPSIVTLLEADRLTVPLSVLEEIGRIKDTDLQCEIYDKYVNEEITRDEIKDYKRNFPAGKKEEIKTIEQQDKEINTYLLQIYDSNHNLIKEDLIKAIDKNEALELSKEKYSHEFNEGFSFNLYFDAYLSPKIKDKTTDKDDKEEDLVNSKLIQKNTYLVEICEGDTVFHSDTFEAANENQALSLAYKKYPDDANSDFDFKVEEINNSFDKEVNVIKDDMLNKTFIQIGTGSIVPIEDIDEIVKLQNENKRLKEENEQLKKQLEDLKNSTQEKPKSFKEQYEESKNQEQSFKDEIKKEIRHIEISDSIYIEYTDMDCDTVSYSKAKQIIKELQTPEFTYVSNGAEKVHNFLNSIPRYGSDHNKIVLKDKYRVK